MLKNGRVVDFSASCCEETEAILLLRQKMDLGTIIIILYHNRGTIELYYHNIYYDLMNGGGQERMGVVKHNGRGQMSRFRFSESW